MLTNPIRSATTCRVIVVDLRQLGTTGPDGAWSVVAVSEPPVSSTHRSSGSTEVTEVASPGPSVSPGHVDDLYDGAPAVEAHVFDGPALEPSLGAARYELTDRTFAFEVEVGADTGRAGHPAPHDARRCRRESRRGPRLGPDAGRSPRAARRP